MRSVLSSKLIRKRGSVLKYVPDKLYGFVVDEKGDQAFFHVRAFDWGDFKTRPPPIVGETVEVEYCPKDSTNGKAPRARRVWRLEEPRACHGIVEDFHEERGYGFIVTSEGKSHYLHRSEMTDGSLPRPGMEVTFFEGFRQGRPRACYVVINKK
jgi:cold shock CspA family protein